MAVKTPGLKRLALLVVVLGAGPAAATTTTTVVTTTTSTTLRPFTADDICSPSQDPCQVDRTIAVPNQSLLNFGNRALLLTSRGVLDTGGGKMTINAGSFEMMPGAQVVGRGPFTHVKIGTSGDIKIRAQANTRAKIDLSSPDSGGTLELTVTGAGNVTIDGTVIAKGTDSSADGGSISVTTAAGDVTINAGDGDFSVTGGSQGTGGEILLKAGRDLSCIHLLDASAGYGGDIDADAGRNASFNKLSVDAAGEGDGGTITLTAAADMTLPAVVSGSGSGDLGLGADIAIAAGGTLTISGDVVANPGIDGDGGTIDIGTVSGTLVLTGALKAPGNGEGCGGDITVESDDGTVDVRGLIDVSSGPWCAGTVFLATRGSLVIANQMTADGDIGAIDARARNITFADTAQVHADGSGQGSAGDILATATCALTVAPAARLSTAGSGGSNTLKSGKDMVVGGRLTSGGINGAGGKNTIEYRDAAIAPVVTGAIVPTATVTVNTALAGCIPPSTSTTTSTSSTTTTTIEGFCRSDADCTKVVSCTSPRCAANACEYPATVGREGVLCRIDQLQTELAGSPSAIKKKGVGKSLSRALAKARTFVQQATGNKAKSRFKKARAQLATFVKTVRKGRGKTIDESFATRVDGIASVAVSELGGLTTGR